MEAINFYGFKKSLINLNANSMVALVTEACKIDLKLQRLDIEISETIDCSDGNKQWKSWV